MNSHRIKGSKSCLVFFFALLNDMAGLSAHPELRRITVETPNGPVTYPAPASRFDGVTRPVGPVPELDVGC